MSANISWMISKCLFNTPSNTPFWGYTLLYKMFIYICWRLFNPVWGTLAPDTAKGMQKLMDNFQTGLIRDILGENDEKWARQQDDGYTGSLQEVGKISQYTSIVEALRPITQRIIQKSWQTTDHSKVCGEYIRKKKQEDYRRNGVWIEKHFMILWASHKFTNFSSKIQVVISAMLNAGRKKVANRLSNSQ